VSVTLDSVMRFKEKSFLDLRLWRKKLEIVKNDPKLAGCRYLRLCFRNVRCGTHSSRGIISKYKVEHRHTYQPHKSLGGPPYPPPHESRKELIPTIDRVKLKGPDCSVHENIRQRALKCRWTIPRKSVSVHTWVHSPSSVSNARARNQFFTSSKKKKKRKQKIPCIIWSVERVSTIKNRH